MDVLATQVSATECALTVVPVPDNGTVAGELPASLVKVAVPLAAPFVCGAKVIAIEVEAPAATVNGVAVLFPNPAPLTEIDETVTLAVPELESVTVLELLLPTFTFPKARGIGEAFSVPTGVETPVPVNVTVFGELLKLLTIDAEPVALPTL